MKKNFAVLLSLISTLLFSLPAVSQTATVAIPGLKANVTVRRDARDIPYIEATSDADLYFAQGYVTASDRLWQMDLMRRVARGETAEIFGNQALEQDKRWRRFNFSMIAEENLRYLSPDLRSALDSYAKGVNAYIATLTPETLPVEFHILQYPPTPVDAVRHDRYRQDPLRRTEHDLAAGPASCVAIESAG